MILSDVDIKKAIKDGHLIIEPGPIEIASTAVDLRVGKDFRKWPLEKIEGLTYRLDLTKADVIALVERQTEPMELVNGKILIEPKDFVLVKTLEKVTLPINGKLAARVEGRSSLARLGVGAHISAPTIHAGFRGRIMLEILNHGPITLELRPGVDSICQLVIEQVSSVPEAGIKTKYLDQ